MKKICMVIIVTLTLTLSVSMSSAYGLEKTASDNKAVKELKAKVTKLKKEKKKLKSKVKNCKDGFTKAVAIGIDLNAVILQMSLAVEASDQEKLNAAVADLNEANAKTKALESLAKKCGIKK